MADLDQFYKDAENDSVFYWTLFPTSGVSLEVGKTYCFRVQTETSEAVSVLSEPICITVERYRISQMVGFTPSHKNGNGSPNAVHNTVKWLNQVVDEDAPFPPPGYVDFSKIFDIFGANSPYGD